jgi:hypothetical protein
MGKTKGGRVMNPTDAGRKLARKREINRNKKERDLQRATPKDVEEIKTRLADLIAEEEAAKAMGKTHSKDLHIRRKVLQDAMKLAVAKERVCYQEHHAALLHLSSRESDAVGTL